MNAEGWVHGLAALKETNVDATAIKLSSAQYFRQALTALAGRWVLAVGSPATLLPAPADAANGGGLAAAGQPNFVL